MKYLAITSRFRIDDNENFEFEMRCILKIGKVSTNSVSYPLWYFTQFKYIWDSYWPFTEAYWYDVQEVKNRKVCQKQRQSVFRWERRRKRLVSDLYTVRRNLQYAVICEAVLSIQAGCMNRNLKTVYCFAFTFYIGRNF